MAPVKLPLKPIMPLEPDPTANWVMRDSESTHLPLLDRHQSRPPNHVAG